MTQRQRIAQKSTVLLKEFESLRTNSRLTDILNSFFLYDEEIDAPSEDLISLIAGVILDDRDLLKTLNDLTVEDGIAEIADRIAQTKIETSQKIAKEEAEHQILFSLFYPDDGEGERLSKWRRLVKTMRDPKETIDRIFAQKVIDVMVARAIWHLDYQSLEALARVNKEIATNSYEKVSASREVTRQIIRHEEYLSDKLKRPPSKTEIKDFLLGIDDSLSDSPKLWSKAFKLLGWTSKSDRKMKSADKDIITKLILSYEES